ncbi:MAG: GntR family transcriptional regulator [Caulobacteraceae bacterium]
MIRDEEEDIPADSLGERVYQGVKAYVMSTARPGRRLDVPMLAEVQKASLTPVRAALHRLAGEGLIEATPSEGFRTPHLTLRGLRDLYEWNRRLLVQALSPPLRPERLAGAAVEMPPQIDPPHETARLFRAIAGLAGNSEIERAVTSASDRLHRVRGFELAVLGDGVEDLRTMASLLAGSNATKLRAEAQIYHRRRLRAVADIVDHVERQR